MQKIHFHNDFDVHLNFDNIKTDYVSRVEFWTRRDDIYCCCKCDGSLKVENDTNIVCYLNNHNLNTGKLNYNVIFQIPDINYADGYKKVCQHYVSDIFLTSENGDTTVAIVKVLGGEEATDLINRLSEFEKVFDNKQDKLEFDTTPTLGSKNVVYSDGIYSAIKNNKPDLSDYAKKSDLEGLATEKWVDDKGYITSIPDDYITESELDSKGYLTEHQSLEDYAKKSDIPSVEGLATEQWVTNQGYLTEHQSLSDYAKKSDLEGLATEQWVDDKGYLTEHQSLEGYVTETELNNKGYLTEHQSLEGYAKKSDIPSLQGLATEKWVTNQGYITSIPSDYVTETELDSKGYLTEHQSLADYAKKTDLQGLATEQWVDDKGYITSIPDDYVTESELNSKGYVPEKFDSDNYNSHIDVKRASIFLDSENWKKYVKLDPSRIMVYDKGTQGQEIYTQLTTNTIGVVKSKDGKTDLAAFLITDEGKGSLRVKDSENELNISVDGITIKEGFYEYNIPLSKIRDMATKSDLQGLATEQWVTDKGYITSIPDDYAKKSDIPSNTSIETVTPAADTEYTLNSNQYLKIIPRTDAVKLTFNRLDNTDLMREYHILIDCNTAVPTAEFEGVVWEIDNDPSFEKDKIYDIVIRDDGDNMYGSWKAYKLMGITILITTSDAAAVQLNGTTYNLVAGDNSLTDIDLKTITDIDGFTDNNNITSIDFGGSTIKIADLSEKFAGMNHLTKISNITIEDATLIFSMFATDTQLQKIDTLKWDVSKVTDFTDMFRDCQSLTSLDVSKWDTSNATDLPTMFSGCTNLKTLDVSGWNVSSATDFSNMFYNCGGLTSLDLSKWNTSKATNFGSMFKGCSSLTSLDVSNFNTSKVESFSEMFSGCSSLTSLDVSNFNTSSATNFGSMFSNCSKLTTLDVSHWDVSKVTDFSSMFFVCRSVYSINVSSWNTISATNFYCMFSGCNSLTSLDVSSWNTSNVTNFAGTFGNCRSLKTLDLSSWNVSSATDLNVMFYGCTNLKTLDISGWNISASANITDMLTRCNYLTTIKMKGCSQATIDKIKSIKPASATIITE